MSSITRPLHDQVTGGATSGPFQPVEVTRVTTDRPRAEMDVAATEAPLQVRLNGEPFAVIMRTPGADVDLAAGFLLSEGVVERRHQIGAICHTAGPGEPANRNVVDVALVTFGNPVQRRKVVTNSSCGACGKVSLEALRVDAPPITASWQVAAGVIRQLPERLRAAQHVFNETGGLHAAALFDAAGRLDALAEDVGRHNAVDKVLGRMFMADRLPLDRFVLFLSGRTSFEILQKAALAGIPIVAAVSAPSTLAIQLARDCGVSLLGFVRGSRFNIYTHPHRVIA
jgi:FdhD protein